MSVIYDNDYYYQFLVGEINFRIAKVAYEPRVISIRNEVVKAEKLGVSYLVISVSPSNALVTKENIQFDYAGEKVILAPAEANDPESEIEFDDKGIFEILDVRALSSYEEQSILGLPEEISANAGDYVIEFKVTDTDLQGATETVAGGQVDMFIGASWNVIISYPALPEEINNYGEELEPIVMEVAYSRSVNAFGFTEKDVVIKDSDIMITPAKSQVFYDETGTIALYIALSDSYTSDQSFIEYKSFGIKSIELTDDEGAVSTLIDNGDLDQYLVLSFPEMGGDNQPRDIANVDIALVAGAFDAIDAGKKVVFTFEAKAGPVDGTNAGGSATQEYVLEVKKVGNETEIHKASAYVPASAVTKEFSKSEIEGLLTGVFGFSAEDAETATGAVSKITKEIDGSYQVIEAGNTDFDAFSFSWLTETDPAKLTASNAVSPGEYEIYIEVTVGERVVTVKQPVYLAFPKYTINVVESEKAISLSERARSGATIISSVLTASVLLERNYRQVINGRS